MIHTVLFDLDNTLLDFNKAERIALSKALRRLGIEPDEGVCRRYSELNLAQWKLLEQGRLTRPQVKIRRFELLFAELGIDCSAETATGIYEAQLAVGHYYIDGAQTLLETLSKTRRLYLVTNGTASVQRSRIESAGLQRYFQDFFISEEIGFDKPHREFFTYCFARIPDFRRREAVLIGDSLTSDIQGGKNAGLCTVWFNPLHQPGNADILPDYAIDRLQDLEALLAGLD